LKPTLVDPYGRPVNSLRISITQRCNFSCFFCHQEGEHDSGTEMTPEEIEAVVSVASELGISKIKLTGGEPLIRNDIIEIVRRVSPYVSEVSMTTNASLLKEKAQKLAEAGLKRVNISLHSLDEESFKKITGHGDRYTVIEGIEAAKQSGLEPVKLNMVVMKDVNSDELNDLINFSKETSTILQLIEFQELENGIEFYDDLHFDLAPVEKMLEERSEKIIERELHRRKVYHLKDGAQVEVVRPMHNSTFCAYCTRLRLTSDGKLKACLMRDDNLVPIVSLIRVGASHSMLVEAFKEAVSFRVPYWREQ
jgi:cyclic pyranopterin phosphate synthase